MEGEEEGFEGRMLERERGERGGWKDGLRSESWFVLVGEGTFEEGGMFLRSEEEVGESKDGESSKELKKDDRETMEPSTGC